MKGKVVLKRLLCIFTAFILMFTLLNIGVFDAEAEARPATKVVLGTADGKGIELNAETPVYVNGAVAATKLTGDGVFSAFLDIADSTNPVLCLNGLKIDGYYLDTLQSDIAYGLYADGDLTIRMDGSSEITNSYSAEKINFGIKSEGRITFKSDTEGSLYANCKKSADSFGVEAAGINVNSGNITFESEGASGESTGVRSSEDINVSGGKLTAKAGTVEGANFQISYGIYSSGKFTQSAGEVIGEGGDIIAGAEHSTNSFGIYASGMEVTGGVMTGTGGSANSQSIGIEIFSSEVTDLVVSGGVVTATGGMVNGDLVGSEDGTVQGRTSYGLSNFNGNVILNGGELIAKGGPTKDSKGLSHGIYYGSKLEISGGRLLSTINKTSVGGYSFVTTEGTLPTLSAAKYNVRLEENEAIHSVEDGLQFVAWYSDYTEIIHEDFVQVSPTAGPTSLPTGNPTQEPTNEPTDGFGEGPTICPTPKVVKKVKFVKKNVKIKKGRKTTLRVKLTPSKGLIGSAKKVKWSIDKKGKKIVKFTKTAKKLKGKLKVQIKAMKKGKAKVTCKAPNGKKAVCKISVR